MKKVILIVLSVLLINTTFAQEHNLFTSVSTTYTANSTLTYSTELGLWGDNTCYSITLDREVSGSTWLGVRPYFGIYDNKEVNLMFYFQPKFNLNDKEKQAIEIGLNPYYKLRKDLLINTTVGLFIDNKQTQTYFLSFGLVKIFN